MWPQASSNHLQETQVIIKHQKKEAPPLQQLSSQEFHIVDCWFLGVSSFIIKMLCFRCSPRLRSSSQNMLRPWRDMHGSRLILTAKVKKTHLFPPTVLHHLRVGFNTPFVSLVTFLPENVFLLLQSVVVSFITHILAQHRISWSILPLDRENGLHDIRGVQMNALELISLRQWNVSAPVLFSHFQSSRGNLALSFRCKEPSKAKIVLTFFKALSGGNIFDLFCIIVDKSLGPIKWVCICTWDVICPALDSTICFADGVSGERHGVPEVSSDRTLVSWFANVCFQLVIGLEQLFHFNTGAVVEKVTLGQLDLFS